MAQLDRLLEAMRDARGEVLRLRADDLAHILRNGSEQPITRQALTRTHVLGLIREKAPSALHGDLQAGHNITFQCDGPAGRYEAEVRFTGETCVAHFRSLDAAKRTPNASVRIDPARKAVMDALLAKVIQRRASDLHLRAGGPPFLRVDGRLFALDAEPTLGSESLRELLGTTMSAATYQEFARTHDADYAYEVPGLARFRVNVFLDRHGIAAVFRVVPSRIVTADELGLPGEVRALCQQPKGLVLVTGPSGSGKSTTLCALIDLVNRTRHDHIITIEDPIEFVHEPKKCLVSQRQVGLHTSSFKQALRAALREDPDVVLVSELRDCETLASAMETAESGHLVFATLPTPTAVNTIDRIIDQFPADRQSQVRVLLAESLKGVISQVLCRKAGGGRVAAMEIMLATPGLSTLIRESKTFQIPSVMRSSRNSGMVTLNDALLDLVDKGLIEVREAYLRATDKSAVMQGLLSRGHDGSFAGGPPANGTSAPPKSRAHALGSPERVAASTPLHARR